MAERTLKIADRDAIVDDDPFAELTRIMGFDPRQPVSRQEAPDPVMGDDFDIDLEKELMGEFGLEADETTGSADVEASPEPYAASADLSSHELDEAVAASMQDVDLAAEDGAQHDAAPQVEFDRDFDDALTRSFEAEPAWPQQGEAVEEAAPLAEELTAPHDFEAHFAEAMAEVDMDFGLDADDGEPEEPAAVEAVAPQPPPYRQDIEAAFEPDTAETAADPFDEAFSLDLDEDEVAAPAVEPVAAQATGSDGRSLEDELNALLGNMGARISKPDGVAVPHAWAASARPAPAADPFAVAAAGYGAYQASSMQESVAVDAGHVEPTAEDIDFDPADFEVVQDEPVAAAPATPIFSRSWNRAIPVEQTSPAPAEVPEPAGVEEAPVFASAYQAEPEVAFAGDPQAATEQEEAASAAAYDDVPDVETVDVPERVEALADDLDLPELVFEEDRPAAAAFDDLDAEFAGLIDDMNDTEVAPPPAARAASYDDEPYQAGFKPVAAEGGAMAYAAAPAPGFDDFDHVASDARPFAPAESFDADPLDYDPELDEAIAIPDQAMAAAVQPSRRGLIAAAVVGAVVVIGGLGAFALSPGSGGSEAPVLVKADDSPIKVKPENPGGTVVPNQDNKVYEAVAKGIQPAAPEQQELVVDSQQPVNVNTAAPQNRVVDLSPDESDEAAPVAKSEDRIDPDMQQTAAAETNQDVALVSPRKVRTMIVKPDGTLAPREETAAPVADIPASEPTDPAPQRVVSASAEEDHTGTVPAAAGEAVAKPAAKAKAQSATTPQTVAAVPQRPSDQPVDIVGEVKPDEVASIAPTAAAAGSWSMQIASQPSADAAQSTYKDLARRYAGVLEGQPVNIVKAEIAGKGTFYRVRVPANSRNDAIKLCESYKAAGGNCFVSK